LIGVVRKKSTTNKTCDFFSIKAEKQMDSLLNYRDALVEDQIKKEEIRDTYVGKNRQKVFLLTHHGP
jgi:hypothetical protein